MRSHFKTMNFYESSLEKLQNQAAGLLKTGQKDEAREVLREALALDRSNLATWELLWHASHTAQEELSSVRHILQIDPRHAAAKKRMAELQAAGVKKSNSQPISRTTPKRPTSRRNRKQASTLLLLLGGFILVLCVGITGLALVRGGYLPFLFASNLTATAIAERSASCQALIDRTIQASDNFCDGIPSNTACYGNNTLKVDLVPGAVQRFSERGDTAPVSILQQVSASPLNLSSNEWGIAIFRVVANLPRSLPGETVTMVVFGNTTLDNQSSNSDSLESFYFSSELGQIVCDKLPFDGMMISSPDGGGIHFTVNGAELTLMGDASIKAVKNEEMQVSVYKGSARMVANGEEQYFGAGESSTVKLGGENGTEAISAPSKPEALSGDELSVACSVTGEFCSPAEIQPITESQAQAEIQNAITSTPTLTPTSTVTRTPSPTLQPTYTLVVLPSATPSRTITPSPTNTKPPTKTPVPSQTQPFTPTNTKIPTSTPGSPIIPICGSVASTSLINPNPNQISMDITNNTTAPITVNRFFSYWVKLPNSQKIDKLFLNGALIWNTSDPDSPSDIPTEGNWVNTANLTIPASATETFLIQFSNPLQVTGYEVHISFDIGCQVFGLK